MNFFLFLWSELKRFDWIIIGFALGIVAVGLSAIYSIDLSRGDTLTFFPTQSLALFLGLGGLFLLGSLHVSVFRSSAQLSYWIALLLLVGVLIFGDTIRGTTGWFRVFGFSFQPAEFAKIGCILMLSWWINKQGRRFDRLEFVVSSGLSTLIVCGLILLQPDLGSASVIGAIWFGMLVLAGVQKKYIGGLMLFLGAATLFSWFFLFAPYQKDRVLNFLYPEKDPLRSGYNVSQSIIAIGAGQITGRGLGFGSQSQLHFLPEAQTDFIISVIGEELGFVGISLVLFLFIGLLWRLLSIARRTEDDFCAFILFGTAILFFVQIFVNIGGATGVLPVTGVTLPFLSYGGSSLIMNFLLLGIVQSVVRSLPKMQKIAMK
jgi:rod shape-determining protein RodA